MLLPVLLQQQDFYYTINILEHFNVQASMSNFFYMKRCNQSFIWVPDLSYSANYAAKLFVLCLFTSFWWKEIKKLHHTNSRRGAIYQHNNTPKCANCKWLSEEVAVNTDWASCLVLKALGQHPLKANWETITHSLLMINRHLSGGCGEVVIKCYHLHVQKHFAFLHYFWLKQWSK